MSQNAIASSSTTAAKKINGVIPKSREIIEDSDVETENDQDSESDDDSVDSDNLEAVIPKKVAFSNQVNGTSHQKKQPDRYPPYQPPQGMKRLPLSVNFASSPFEFDSLAARKGVELWAIRTPISTKPNRLSGLMVTIDESGPSGSLITKSQSYTLSVAGSSRTSKMPVNEEGRQPNEGNDMVNSMLGSAGDEKDSAGEMSAGLSLMVPKMKDGNLYPAPITIAQHLVLTPTVNIAEPEEPALPSLLATQKPTLSATAPPAKRSQPAHLMKFRNKVYGYNTSGPGIKSDAAAPSPFAAVAVIPNVKEETSPVKRKRKSEMDAEGDLVKVKKKKKAKD